MSAGEQRPAAIGGLGEVALRVDDLDRMQAFYADTLGFELMKRFPHAAFFRLAEGFAGHTELLALFDRSGDGTAPPDAARSTLDHLAFTIRREDYEAQKRFLEAQGLEVTTAEHAWVQWRSLYVSDPEGNLIEWVCFDPSIERE